MPNFRKLAGTTESQLWVAKESTTGAFSGIYLENVDGDPAGLGAQLLEPSGPDLIPLKIGTPTQPDHAATKAYADGLVGGADQGKWVKVDIASPAASATVSSTFLLPTNCVVLQARVLVTAAYDDTGTKTIAVDGGTGTPIVATTDVSLKAVDTYFLDQIWPQGGGAPHAIDVTVSAGAGDGTTGSASVYIMYVEAPAT